MLKTEDSELLQKWNASKKALDWHKEEEAKLRAQVGLTVFPEVKKGATTIELGAGYRATYTVKINHKLGKPPDAPAEKTILEAMDELHNEMRQASNEGSFIFSRLVKFKPELSVSEYNKLPDNLRAIVNKYVTTSEGAPTLEIKEPAKGK